MTREEKAFLLKLDKTFENSDLFSEENRPKCAKFLLIYFKTIRQIILGDKKCVKQCLERLAKIKPICQQMEIEKLNPEEAMELYWAIIKVESFWKLDSYIQFMEKNRDPLKKFYAPRRDVLLPVVEDLQALEDSKTQKFYGLSLPSRTGKSTTCIFFLSWIALRRPNSHSAMGGHSGMLAKGFYKELINIFESSDYHFAELFYFFHPEYAGKPVITDRSAEDLTITLGDSDRFATITCRGIDGTWTGAVDVSDGGYLYVDDLVRDREHSLNPQRMENTWQEYLNKMVDRKSGSNRLGGAKELMVGTLWNIYDPLKRMEEIYGHNPDYVFRKIPALDYVTDESNFNYKINGFSTQYYREMREKLDPAEWMSKFQQQPQIREGILFPKEELKRFHMLESDKYETTAVCDPALGGGDFLSMPIERHCDNKKYCIIDWIYDPSSTKVTVPQMVDKIIRWHITKLTIEIDGGAGTLVHKELVDELKRRDVGFCEINPKHSSTRLSKEDKIKGRSDFIKDNFYFLDEAITEGEYVMSAQYKKALNDTCIYTTLGKNLHDDAPDSLSQMALDIHPFAENGVVYVPDINPFRSYGGKMY